LFGPQNQWWVIVWVGDLWSLQVRGEESTGFKQRHEDETRGLGSWKKSASRKKLVRQFGDV